MIGCERMFKKFFSRKIIYMVMEESRSDYGYDSYVRLFSSRKKAERFIADYDSENRWYIEYMTVY